jgi:hypothetical protein
MAGSRNFPAKTPARHGRSAVVSANVERIVIVTAKNPEE